MWPLRAPRPALFALASALLYLALLLGLAAPRGFDPSVFIFAGDHFADPARVDPPIAIARNTLGYDGQFFYRLALDPWSTAPDSHGLHFDSPAKRMLRILYPLLARAAALGQAAWTPVAMIAVNLAGIALLAYVAAWLARRQPLAGFLPYALLLWPGLLVTLAHDTAEIVTAALLLAALAALLRGRIGLYAVLAAAALLTRETALPITIGILLAEAAHGLRRRCLIRPALAALPPLALALWWAFVAHLWHQSPHARSAVPDLGPPFLGLFEMLRTTLDGSRHWNGDPSSARITAIFVVTSALLLLGFGLVVLLRLPRLRALPERGASTAAWHGIALGWLGTAFLMSLLTADGPWVEPLSYFRAFTEFWLVGCLLLARDPPGFLGHRLVRILALLAGIEGLVAMWKWSLWLLTGPNP